VDAPEATTAEKLRSTELGRALDSLNPRMRRVLALRFGLDGETARTLEQVGDSLGITRERVRQLGGARPARAAHGRSGARAQLPG
jgi:RNA polymerase primary sigma factor